MSWAPHPFSLRQLQYVVAVADELSFRRAAERCRVAQPSLSAQLAQVEAAIGVQLFERDRRRVLLTAAGSALVQRARRILLEADDLVDAARTAGDPLLGTLRIGVIPTISPYLLPSVTPKLRARFGRLHLAWIEDKTEVLVQQLAAGTLDAALLALEAELGDLEHEVIAQDAFVLAAPAAHVLAKKTSALRIDVLHDMNVLLLDDSHCLRGQVAKLCVRARAQELEFRATSLSTLVQMVAGGAGITLLPALAVTTEARRAKLCVRSFAAPAPYRTIALCWRRSSPLSEALRKLSVVIRDAYPQPVSKPAGRRQAPPLHRRRQSHAAASGGGN